MKTRSNLKVFYDGACGVCDNEMAYYRTIADQRIRFINIAAEDFHAEQYGKTDEEFQKVLHVCDDNNRFYTGVEAFRKLWEALPSPFYPLLSSFVGLPGINFAARCGYTVFARFRHFLPAGSSNSCKLHAPGKH